MRFSITTGRVSVVQIGARGVAYAWLATGRDGQPGQPVGRAYLAQVAKILPGGELHGDEAHPEAWAVRLNGRPTLDLQLLLIHQDAWLGAIAALRDQLLELQRQRDTQWQASNSGGWRRTNRALSASQTYRSRRAASDLLSLSSNARAISRRLRLTGTLWRAQISRR